MSETKLNLARDLSEASEMAEMLPDYLIGDQLYSSMSGGIFGSGSKPALTLGALLLRLRRLRQLENHLSSEQQTVLAKAERDHEQARREWHVHYEEKLVHEANSRLDAMRTFFDECVQNPRQCAGLYLPEAMRRTIVQEIALALAAENITSTELTTKMREIDGHLRRHVRASEFIWANELAPVYPQETFWWLYSRPPVVS
ncbi:MAG: hypothetical protein KC547_01705 [Anaerolineae bacterium]|nr:hypothetical protein [Anaerolineae bacterium]